MTPDFKQASIADTVLPLHRRLVAAKHVRKAGPAIWVLLALLDWRTGPRGEVNEGDPVQLRELAGRLGLSERTVSAHLHRLERSGYIRLGRTDYGFRITLVDQLWVPTRVPDRQMDEQRIGRNLPVRSKQDQKISSDLTVITNKGRWGAPSSKETSSANSSLSSADPISQKARLVAELQGLPPERAEVSSWRQGAERLLDYDNGLIRDCLADAELWQDRHGRPVLPEYVADRLPLWLTSRPQPQLTAEDWDALRRHGVFDEARRLFEARNVTELSRLVEQAWEAAG